MADNCKYCKVEHNSVCLNQAFYENKVEFFSETLLKNTSPEKLLNFSFHFEARDTGDRYGFLYLKKVYAPWVNVVGQDGKKKSWRLFRYKGVSFQSANEANIEMREILVKTQEASNKIVTEKLLQSQANQAALHQAAREAKNQGLHLDPTKYTDIKDYLSDLEKLKKKNQETINTLKVSPEEHAAAIARLQQIQAELEKRKRIAQELEQSQIFEKITQQKHDLELTNKQIDDKAKEVKQAQEAGETAKAKKLNEEYLELKRKQGAILAFVENLEQNAQYNTFVKFDSLEQLYSPSYQWPTNDEVLIEEYQFTTWDKVQPYVWGGLGIGGVILAVYLLYRNLVKQISV